jgi:hypothetical protein
MLNFEHKDKKTEILRWMSSAQNFQPLLVLGDTDDIAQFVLNIFPKNQTFFIENNNFGMFNSNIHKFIFAHNFIFNEKNFVLVHELIEKTNNDVKVIFTTNITLTRSLLKRLDQYFKIIFTIKDDQGKVDHNIINSKFTTNAYKCLII